MQNINPLTGKKNGIPTSKTKRITTKHNASKKGFGHPHKKLSKGELNHLRYIQKSPTTEREVEDE